MSDLQSGIQLIKTQINPPITAQTIAQLSSQISTQGNQFTTLSPALNSPNSPNGNVKDLNLGTAAGWLFFLMLATLTGCLWRKQNARTTAPPLSTELLRYIEAGKQFEYQKDYRQAIASYDEGLQAYPNDYHLWHERGLAFAKLRRFKDAIASYDRAYELHPQARDFAHERGDALLELERYAEAVASFDLCLRYEPNSSHIWNDRGFALYQLGRYAEALQSLQRSQKLERGEQSGEAQRNRYYEIATLYQLGQIAAAAIAAQRASQKYPDQSHFKTLYATLQRSPNSVKFSL